MQQQERAHEEVVEYRSFIIVLRVYQSGLLRCPQGMERCDWLN